MDEYKKNTACLGSPDPCSPSYGLRDTGNAGGEHERPFYEDVMPQLDLGSAVDMMAAVTEMTAAEPETVELDFELPVGYGDYSYDVYHMQERLIALGYLGEDEADGNFGPKTQEAVKSFQQANGLEATGEVDEETYYALSLVHAVTAAEAKAMSLVTETTTQDTAQTACSGHVHDYVAYVTSASCTSDGYTTHVCSCGASYTDYTPATGSHSFTMTVLGSQIVYTCTVCGYSYSEAY